MLPPQSRLSATEKSVSSSGSSHRPLFSPTKTSAIKVAPSHQPTTVTTYSSRTDSPSKTKSAQPLFDPPYVSSSPTSESAPVRPATVERKVVAWSSDHEIEEQIEEARGKSRSNLEVLMPAKEKSRSRAHSPDPLDSLPNWTAMAAATDAPPRVTASSPLAPTSENRQIASASTTTAGRGIEEKASGSTRRGSSRVQDKEAKRAFEKAERRRKQALEKEEEAKKEAKKATERDGEAANKQSAAGDAPRRIGRETRQSPIKRLTGKGVESERYIKENPRAEETHEKDDHDSRSSVIESPLNPVLPVRPGNAQTVSRSTARAADRSKKRKADALEHDHDDDDGASWDGEIQEKKSAGKREVDAGKAKGGRKPPLQKNPAKEVVPEEAAVTVETSTFDVQENAEDMSRSPDKQVSLVCCGGLTSSH